MSIVHLSFVFALCLAPLILTSAEVDESGEDAAWTVARCVAEAQARNPSVLSAEAEARGAGAVTAIARGQRLPTIVIAVDYAHHLDPQRLSAATANNEAGVFDDGIVDGAVRVALPLYTGGRLAAEVRAALSEEEARRATVSRARQEIAAQTAVIAWLRIAQDHLIDAVVANRAAIAARRATLEQLRAQGKAIRLDVLKMDARPAALDSTLADERGRAAVLDRTLLALLGGELETVPAIMDILPMDLDTPIEDEQIWLRRAFAQRPDLQATRANLSAAQERGAVARAGHLPRLDLFGSLGVRSAEDFSEHDTVGAVGLSLTIPVFAGGRISGEVERQRWEMRAEQHRFQELYLRIATEIGTAWSELTATQIRLRAAQAQVAAASEVVRLERQRVENAQATTNDVLDAEAAYLDATTSVTRAAAGVQAAQWQLRLAAGDIP